MIAVECIQFHLGLDRENQKLESELARYEVYQQELDSAVDALTNMGKEIPEVVLTHSYSLVGGSGEDARS